MGNSQTLVMMPQNQFDALVAKMDRIESLLLGNAKKEVEGEWIESEEARKLLGISPKTWQNWRDSRRFPFSQFGKKIWVKRADIEAFLQSKTIKARED